MENRALRSPTTSYQAMGRGLRKPFATVEALAKALANLAGEQPHRPLCGHCHELPTYGWQGSSMQAGKLATQHLGALQAVLAKLDPTVALLAYGNGTFHIAKALTWTVTCTGEAPKVYSHFTRLTPGLALKPLHLLAIAWVQGEADLWLCQGAYGVVELRRYYADDETAEGVHIVVAERVDNIMAVAGGNPHPQAGEG